MFTILAAALALAAAYASSARAGALDTPGPVPAICHAPARAQLLAQDTEAAIYSVARVHGLTISGCMLTTGTSRVLYETDDPTGQVVASANGGAIAGTEALVDIYRADKYMNTSDELVRFNLLTGLAHTVDTLLTQLGTVSQLAVSTAGAAAWTAQDQYPPQNAIESISCPAMSECVAVDEDGNVGVSSSPAAGPGAWRFSPLAPAMELGPVSCVPGLCAIGEDNGIVATSSDPAAPAGAWRSVQVVKRQPYPGFQLLPLRGLTCPSVSLCVGSDGSGGIDTTTSPLAGLPWRHTVIDPPRRYETALADTIACPSPTFCLATTPRGRLILSRRPGRDSWRHIPVLTSDPLESVQCPTVRFCEAVDNAGHSYTSTEPADAHSWRAHREFPAGTRDADGDFVALVCPSENLCLADDDLAHLAWTTAPTRKGSWHQGNVLVTDPYALGSGPGAIACATSALCLVGDGDGNGDLLTSNAPGQGVRTFSGGPIDPGPCPGGDPCLQQTLYGAGSTGAARILSTSPPGPGDNIADVAFSNPGTLTWTDNGETESASLIP